MRANDMNLEIIVVLYTMRSVRPARAHAPTGIAPLLACHMKYELRGRGAHAEERQCIP